MSSWSHIIGAFHIETMQELNYQDLQAYLYMLLGNAPQITGSEENATYISSIDEGYNFVISVETEEGPEPIELQTCATITIVGDLRDRNYKQTREELQAFAKYLNERVMILNGGFAIQDDINKYFVVYPEALHKIEKIEED